MGNVQVAVINDDDRESVAVFVDRVQVYGGDPYYVDIAQLLRSLFKSLGDEIDILEDSTVPEDDQEWPYSLVVNRREYEALVRRAAACEEKP